MERAVVSPKDSHVNYGPSSNLSFLKQVAVAADPHEEPQELSQDTGVPTLLGFPTSRPSSPKPRARPIILPERAMTNMFMQSYWDFVHPIFPILHQISFTERFKKTTESLIDTLPQDSIFQATLSIALSLGAQRTETVPIMQRESLADELYRQSCNLASIDFLDESSMEVVQLLLLRGIYLHYSTFADRCWNTIGIALRMAQGLGLQHDGNDSGGVNQLTREMRRRVWHCCVTLDRYGISPLCHKL